MGKPIKWNKSYSELAKHYGCTVSALKHWASPQGGSHDLNNDELVKSLVLKHKDTVGKSSVPRKPVTVSLNTKLGIDESKLRLEQLELALGKRVDDAYNSGDPNAPLYLEEWLDVQDALKKTAKEAPNIAELNRTTISIDVVRDGLGKKFNAMRNIVEAFPKRASDGLPDDLGKTVYLHLTKEVDRLIKELHQLKFLEGRE